MPTNEIPSYSTAPISSAREENTNDFEQAVSSAKTPEEIITILKV